MTRVYHWWLALALSALAATPAAAELYRCQDPDGRTIYTDQKDACPGAKPFEPSGQVLSAPTPAGSAQPAPAAPPAAAEPDTDAAMEQHWQDKRRAALAQIAQIQQRRQYLEKYVNHCKWRDYVATRDDAGVEKVVNCSEMRREFAALDEEEAAARDYLNEGLPEECRKAGCLPGWVR
jgi:uncharacterized protein DUF4124